MAALLDEPHLVFDQIRRYTNSVATQFVYGFRTPKIDDPNLVQLYDSVEKWSAVTGAGSAALLDVFPILRSLPPAVRPLYNYALSLKREYFDLALSHWGNAKRGVQEGTAKVRFPHLHLTHAKLLQKRLADSNSVSAFLLRWSRQRSGGRRNQRRPGCHNRKHGIGGQLRHHCLDVTWLSAGNHVVSRCSEESTGGHRPGLW